MSHVIINGNLSKIIKKVSSSFHFQFIRTQPDLVCVVGLDNVVTEIENLMKLNNNSVVFSFQDSHKVGRYWITPFSFLHTLYVQQPAVPVYFLISEVILG